MRWRKTYLSLRLWIQYLWLSTHNGSNFIRHIESQRSFYVVFLVFLRFFHLSTNIKVVGLRICSLADQRDWVRLETPGMKGICSFFSVYVPSSLWLCLRHKKDNPDLCFILRLNSYPNFYGFLNHKFLMRSFPLSSRPYNGKEVRSVVP